MGHRDCRVRDDGLDHSHNRKEMLKKHPQDQGQILLIRKILSKKRDPREVVLEVNKALVQARAAVTVRLLG